jgi:hypothetical protein
MILSRGVCQFQEGMHKNAFSPYFDTKSVAEMEAVIIKMRKNRLDFGRIKDLETISWV